MAEKKKEETKDPIENAENDLDDSKEITENSKMVAYLKQLKLKKELGLLTEAEIKLLVPRDSIEEQILKNTVRMVNALISKTEGDPRDADVVAAKTKLAQLYASFGTKNSMQLCERISDYMLTKHLKGSLSTTLIGLSDDFNAAASANGKALIKSIFKSME